jgi:hypothetical protein
LEGDKGRVNSAEQDAAADGPGSTGSKSRWNQGRPNTGNFGGNQQRENKNMFDIFTLSVDRLARCPATFLDERSDSAGLGVPSDGGSTNANDSG